MRDMLFLLFVICFVMIDITECLTLPETCTLPSCEDVLKSRLYSERCHTAEAGWPLLVTSTPRSATVHTRGMLRWFGMDVHDDWGDPQEDGSISWIFAFEDDDNFGPGRTHGLKFEHGLHQVRDPLKGLTSMCTEPLFRYATKGEKAKGNKGGVFLERHIDYSTAHETPKHEGRAALQFWVEWHTFLDQLKLPVFQIEEVEAKTIFEMSGLTSKYLDKPPYTPDHDNSRSHRAYFTWDEIFTFDPVYARRAWDMAARYGYKYDVEFDELQCLAKMPSCKKPLSTGSDFCPAGTHPDGGITGPHPVAQADPKVGVHGKKGIVDEGCVEWKNDDGSYVGISGLHLYTIPESGAGWFSSTKDKPKENPPVVEETKEEPVTEEEPEPPDAPVKPLVVPKPPSPPPPIDDDDDDDVFDEPPDDTSNIGTDDPVVEKPDSGKDKTLDHDKPPQMKPAEPVEYVDLEEASGMYLSTDQAVGVMLVTVLLLGVILYRYQVRSTARTTLETTADSLSKEIEDALSP